MVCVFAFILSFGLGPGTETETLFFVDSLSHHCWFVTLFLLPCRWSNKHLDHWALHSDSPTGRLRDRRVGELAQLLLHRPHLPFHCGRCPGRSRVESSILNDFIFYVSLFLQLSFPAETKDNLGQVRFRFLNVWFLWFSLHRSGCSSIVSWCSSLSAPSRQHTFSSSFLRPRTKRSWKSRRSSDPPARAAPAKLMALAQHWYRLLFCDRAQFWAQWWIYATRIESPTIKTMDRSYDSKLCSSLNFRVELYFYNCIPPPPPNVKFIVGGGGRDAVIRSGLFCFVLYWFYNFIFQSTKCSLQVWSYYRDIFFFLYE